MVIQGKDALGMDDYTTHVPDQVSTIIQADGADIIVIELLAEVAMESGLARWSGDSQGIWSIVGLVDQPSVQFTQTMG